MELFKSNFWENEHEKDILMLEPVLPKLHVCTMAFSPRLTAHSIVNIDIALKWES